METKTRRSEFDYTMMSTYMTCRRKYDFRINKGLVRKKKILPLEFGGAIHTALDSWYTDKDIDKAVGLFHAQYKEDTSVDDKRTNRLGEWIIRNYDEKYRNQPIELVQSEIEFCIPLPNGNNLIGRIDKIVKWHDCLWVMDHKTTSQLGAQFFKMVSPSLQFPGYCYAAKELGYDVKGIILDAILVAKGLLEASRRRSLNPLARFDSYYGTEDLTDWLSTAQGIQKDISLDEENALWIPNYDACTYYGECPYRTICTEPRHLWDRIIEMDYQVDHWDPRGGKDD